MKTKVRNIKTIRPKKPHELSFVEKIALHAKCSTRMVRYVLTEKRNQETETAQRILLAAAIIEEGENRLLDEVKRIVKF